jgi:hypothetical protein
MIRSRAHDQTDRQCISLDIFGCYGLYWYGDKSDSEPEKCWSCVQLREGVFALNTRNQAPSCLDASGQTSRQLRFRSHDGRWVFDQIDNASSQGMKHLTLRSNHGPSCQQADLTGQGPPHPPHPPGELAFTTLDFYNAFPRPLLHSGMLL